MGPFNLPWSTFLAFIVIVISIGIAISWAVMEKKQDKGRGGKK
jgi:hypothetical protein